MKTEKVPKLRFSGFNENYNRKEFAELVEKRSKSYNPTKESTNYPCIELESLSQETGQLLNTYDSIDLKSNKTRFKKNDVLFGKLRPYLRKYLHADFEGVCTSEIWVFKPNNVNSKFLFYLIQTEKFNYEANVTSGSKMPRADWEYVSRINYSIPPLSEQAKIANFLSVVDAKIANLIEEKSLLENYKKGAMQKIFSQELRFGGENGKWKRVNMNEIFPKIRNGFVGTATPYYVSTGIKYLQGKNIKNGSIDVSGLIHINPEFHDKNKKSQLALGDMLMVQSGHVGECAVVTEDFVDSNCHALLVLSPIERISTHFYKYYFYSDLGKKEIYTIKTGNTIAHILSSDMKNVNVPYPTFEEQTKIANFLTSIDEKINTATEAIEKAQEWKKGLLQQLFV